MSSKGPRKPNKHSELQFMKVFEGFRVLKSLEVFLVSRNKPSISSISEEYWKILKNFE